MNTIAPELFMSVLLCHMSSWDPNSHHHIKLMQRVLCTKSTYITWVLAGVQTVSVENANVVIMIIAIPLKIVDYFHTIYFKLCTQCSILLTYSKD